jgi:phage I-like protein
MERLPKLPVDENHATDLAAPKGGAAPALGWLTNLNADETGAIRADVEWTPRGREAVLNKEYGYISPVFLYNKDGEINCILRAALTNSTNLGLPALNAEQKDNDTEDFMDKALCAALGIAESADVKEALAAVEKLKTTRNAEGGVDLETYAP